MSNILAFFVIILPWVIIPYSKITDAFRAPKSTMFDLMCLSVICFAMFTGLKKRYFNKYLSFFVTWVFITIIFNWYLPYTLIIDGVQRVNLSTIEPTLHFMLGSIFTFICLCSLEEEDFKKLAKVLCFSATAVSSIGILQVLGFDIYGNMVKYNEANRFVAFLDHPNVIANYLALTIPLFFYFNKLKYYLGLTIVLVGVAISDCRGAQLASILGITLFIFIALRNYKKLVIGWIVFLGASFAFILLNINKFYKFFELDSGLMGRLETWGKAINHIKDNPIFGQGLGVFKTWDIRQLHAVLFFYNAHNDWLEIVCQIGLLGLFLLLLVVLNSLRKFNYKITNKLGIAFFCVFIEFLFIMLGSFPLNIAPIVLTGLISFCAVEIL